MGDGYLDMHGRLGGGIKRIQIYQYSPPLCLIVSQQDGGTMTDKPQQWFFLALTALWLVISIIAPIVAYCITHSLYCFVGYLDLAPPTYLLYLLAKRIFPPGDNETKIELAKQHKKGQVP
jgi:hypothetical protein